MGQPIFRRIVLKLSGEVLAGDATTGIDGSTLDQLTSQICQVRNLGVEVAIVIGGGNFVRGASMALPGMDRITADSMGMMATIINALALRSSLDAHGASSQVLSAIPIEGIVKRFNHREALSSLAEGETLVFAGGTGHPFFTTDTTAVLRAVEIKAEAVLKGTRVDGVFSADPVQDPLAIKYDRLTFSDILEKRLKIVDATAASLCMEYDMPLLVFNIRKEGTLLRMVSGERLGTVVKGRMPC